MHGFKPVELGINDDAELVVYVDGKYVSKLNEGIGDGGGGGGGVSLLSQAFTYADFGAGGGNNVVKVGDLPNGSLLVLTWVVLETVLDGDNPRLQFGVTPASNLTVGSDAGNTIDAAVNDWETTFALAAWAINATVAPQAVSRGDAAVIIYAFWTTPPSQGAGTAYALIFTP